MLIPEDDKFLCQSKGCEFATSDLFEYMEHCGVGYEWGVKLSDRYRFDLFQFLNILNDLVDVGDQFELKNHIQSATLLLINASGDDLQRFVEESVVQSEMSDILEEVDSLLKKGTTE